MRQTSKNVKEFVASFGLPAYATGTVPKDIPLPYLTYPMVEPEWNSKATFYIQGWYRATNYTEMLKKADQIIVLDHGAICEAGTHDALVEQGGIYARIYKAQTEGVIEL